MNPQSTVSISWLVNLKLHICDIQLQRIPKKSLFKVVIKNKGKSIKKNFYLLFKYSLVEIIF